MLCDLIAGRNNRGCKERENRKGDPVRLGEDGRPLGRSDNEFLKLSDERKRPGEVCVGGEMSGYWVRVLNGKGTVKLNTRK